MHDNDDYTTSSEYDDDDDDATLSEYDDDDDATLSEYDDDDDATSSEYKEEDDNTTFSESEVNYTTSESEESDTNPSSEEKIFVDMALDEDNLLQFNINNDNGQKYWLKIQKILKYADLPETFKGTLRRNRSLAGEVWLQDEPFIVIGTFKISEKATVMIKFQHQHIPKNILTISEIFYKHQTYWHICDASKMYIMIILTPSSRYHYITDVQFNDISQEPVSGQKFLSTKYKLRVKPSILDRLLREKYLQTSQDIYYATVDKIGCLLKLTCELFSQEEENDFIKIWKNFEKPKIWSHIPNPISHNESFMMSDYLQLAMIIPFILNCFLKISSLKEREMKNIQQWTNALCINL
ncbi:hypothetical protein C1645_825996 [Glomus cerebriforme]|uniref:Uncharacterized protein n=1 Tax=Glomus cerebriforme TaxID=658196 RepID=A0A397SRT5_9GLOM|nr:hypothetical protein C1645_825996 [Glomus cerebriforme]